VRACLRRHSQIPTACATKTAMTMKKRRSVKGEVIRNSAFTGVRFPPDVIVVAVRWYLRFGLSYRDIEELLAERGIRSITSPSTAG
jgi:transposase-like protein